MKDNKAILGAHIKKIRKIKNLSQNALAKLAGISQSGLSAIESGHSSPSFEMLEKILGGMDVSISKFLSTVTKDMEVDYGEVSEEGGFLEYELDGDNSIRTIRESINDTKQGGKTFSFYEDFRVKYTDGKENPDFHEAREIIDDLIFYFSMLNIIGQEKVIAYIEGLLNNPEYVRNEE